MVTRTKALAKSAVDQRDNREIILEELRIYGRRQKDESNGWRTVVCPFHDGFSCGVRVTEPGVGIFNCFGCEEKGNWNKFAEKAGLQPIKAWRKSSSAVDIDIRDLDDRLLGDSGLTFNKVKSIMGCKEAQPWPEGLEWRGFSGEFMWKLGAHIVMDTYADSVGVLFPVKVAGKVRGGIRAVMEKKSAKSIAYINMRGPWTDEYGLFPYVYCKKLLRQDKLRFVVLVEGPRDSMRLCLNGIPALAILGAKNFSKKKLLFITALDLDVIYVMPDNDKGGKVFWKMVKSVPDKSTDIRRVKLPEPKDKDGNIKKIDPGNMKKKTLRRFMKYLNAEHGYELRKPQ